MNRFLLLLYPSYLYYPIPHTGLKCLQISLIFDFVLLINLQKGENVIILYNIFFSTSAIS